MKRETNRYFKGVRLETPIIEVFQSYIEEKRGCKSFLKKRENKQASIDFIGRFYNSNTNKTITEVVVEVRSLEKEKSSIESSIGYINFPIEKLNELMMFWRMKKEVYIVYLLKDNIFFIKWSYYLEHNFEISKDKNGYFIKIPIQNFIYCGDFKS